MQKRYTRGMYSCLKYSIWIRLFNTHFYRNVQSKLLKTVWWDWFLWKAFYLKLGQCFTTVWNCTFFYHIHMDFHDFYGNAPVGLATLLSAVTAMLLLPQTKYRAKRFLAIMSGCLLHSVDTCFVLLVYICLLVHITYERFKILVWKYWKLLFFM